MEFIEVPLEKPTNEVELPSDVKQISNGFYCDRKEKMYIRRLP